jgi:hypothetical protein
MVDFQTRLDMKSRPVRQSEQDDSWTGVKPTWISGEILHALTTENPGPRCREILPLTKLSVTDNVLSLMTEDFIDAQLFW